MDARATEDAHGEPAHGEHARRHTSESRTGDNRAVDDSGADAAARVPPGGRLDPAILRRLQTTAGNRALSGLIAQRYARPGAAASPKFASLRSEVKGKQRALAAHPPATTRANAARAAARPPADDKQAQGKAANAEKMNAAQPGAFDKAAFVAAVNKAIAAQAPKNLDEADNFGDSGKADAVKGQVQSQVGQGKDQSAKAIETTTRAAPDTSAATEKPVTPLVAEPAPGNPGAPNPANAVPDTAPASATDFSAGPAQVDQQMAGAQVTEEQLASSNEPEFTGALKEKKAGEAHAATAPGEVRAAEARTLTDAKSGAQATGVRAVAGMRGDKVAADNAIGKGQQGAQGRDEAKRAQVTAKLQTVFDATRNDVEGILAGLDRKVDDSFSAGEKAAREGFTAEHKRRMDDYKDKRYSGFTGKLRWVKDKFAGLPEEANQIFVTARQGYVATMQTVISNVADVIGGELNRAKQRIATGRQQIQAEVRKLPADLQAVGKAAAGEFSGRFDELTGNVDAKGTELVDTLASRYNDALKSVDAEIDAEKEKNKGLIAKAVDAVKGVIDTILRLKDLLLGVLAKAAAAVMAILKDPIGFLGNLVSAVGAGLTAFMNNIGQHLKKGLIGWLLGAMSGAGLQLPDKFDLRGILSMIGSLLGLTWGAIRGRIVAKGVPEQAMGAVEAGVPVVAKLRSQGVAGAYEEIKDQVGDLKENLLGKISEYLIPTVLIAGITWIISLLNPASAFIKACKMIIDIVTFIIERGAQIIEFVNAVLDAVIAIAGGGAGGVPGLIEAALAKSIPVLIGALAAILGVGGIATKVKSFFQALSKPVMKAVDWVVGKVVGLGKKIWAKIKPKGRNGKGTDGPASPEKSRTAIADADRMLAKGPEHEQAARQVAAISAKHRVPLHLVVETRTPEDEKVHVQTMVTGSHTLSTANAEKQRRELVKTHLPARAAVYIEKVLGAWWRSQLGRAGLWTDAKVLDPARTKGTGKATEEGFLDNVFTHFFKGRRTQPDRPGVWETEVEKGDAFRHDLVEAMGKQAESDLRPAAVAFSKTGEANADYANLAFYTSQGRYGEFEPLPMTREKPEPDLVAAVKGAGGVIPFLKLLARGGSSAGVDYARFIEMWNAEGASKQWIKTQFRGADKGKHEWIPTSYVGDVLTAAVEQRNKSVLPHKCDIAEDWVTLQAVLRSYTAFVVWKVELAEGATEVGDKSVESHVGGWERDGNPIFNGRDDFWHRPLKALFDTYVGSSTDSSTPARYLTDVLLRELDAGTLMWDGRVTHIDPAKLGLHINAEYKRVKVTADGVKAETERLTAITLRQLGRMQTDNFDRVRDDFRRALLQLKVK